MSQVHFGLQGLEIVRNICLGLAPHSLPSPLLETIQFFVDVHFDGWIVEFETAATIGGLIRVVRYFAQELSRDECLGEYGGLDHRKGIDFGRRVENTGLKKGDILRSNLSLSDDSVKDRRMVAREAQLRQ